MFKLSNKLSQTLKKIHSIFSEFIRNILNLVETSWK